MEESAVVEQRGARSRGRWAAEEGRKECSLIQMRVAIDSFQKFTGRVPCSWRTRETTLRPTSPGQLETSRALIDKDCASLHLHFPLSLFPSCPLSLLPSFPSPLFHKPHFAMKRLIAQKALPIWRPSQSSSIGPKMAFLPLNEPTPHSFKGLAERTPYLSAPM